MKQLTLNELIELLQNQVDNDPESGDYKVSVEGCDCSGPAGGIVVDHAFQQVDILRVDQY